VGFYRQWVIVNMNRKEFNIFEKYRIRQLERDLDVHKNSSSYKGEAHKNEEQRLKDNCEDEVAMEKERMLQWESEQKGLGKNQAISKVTNIILTIVAILSFFGTVVFSAVTIEKSKEANIISRSAAEQEYFNQQPFLIIVGGNDDATDVVIKNAGGGPAKDIFFLKHHKSPEATYEYALTKEGNVVLGMAAGAEGPVNLNSQYMNELNTNEVLEKVQCLSSDFLARSANAAIMIFYRNLQGDQFVSHIYGTDAAYDEGLVFEKLNCNE